MSLRSLVEQNQLVTQCVLQWLAQLALTYLTQALIARTDLPMYATLATHDSHSLKQMMTASCTLIISAESCHIAPSNILPFSFFLFFFSGTALERSWQVAHARIRAFAIHRAGKARKIAHMLDSLVRAHIQAFSFRCADSRVIEQLALNLHSSRTDRASTAIPAGARTSAARQQKEK